MGPMILSHWRRNLSNVQCTHPSMRPPLKKKKKKKTILNLLFQFLETCKEEGIACEVEVDYNDNAHCIDLISSLVSC